ncbi:GNAT family N-acetyltransferase [Psychrobacter arenosus]|uniref:GNAT family N-acetyltransferase n=1 Tax=Psychrobacter arenosus TaxID=256326 RepID=UPI0019195F4B|nr:GNAT family protein [Psychrobacter arenosus]
MVAPVFLSYCGITLEPLTMMHAKGLSEACQDGKLWTIEVTSAPTPESVSDYIQLADSMDNRVAFAVIDDISGQVIGSTSYHDILPNAKRLEIGYTWYAQSYWRTYVNTACKLMLLAHAFETLHYQTVGWRTDGENLQSQKAIKRLGAKKDGVIRGNRVRRNGIIADTVMYSMIADEWPDAKATLEEKLAHYS